MRLALLPGSASHLATCPDLGPDCAKSPPPVPYYHHVGLFAADLDLDASYGISRFFAVEARFPLRLVKTTPTYSELDGSVKLVPNDIHHHDETIVGPGDPTLMGRTSVTFGSLLVESRLGLSFPIGSTQPNPFVLAAEGRTHEHTQLGSGTFMPIVGLGGSFSRGDLTFAATALATFSFYANGYGYRAPSRLFASVRTSYGFSKGAVTPYLAVDVAHQTEELWSGSLGAEGPTERSQLFAGGGLAWRFAERTRLELDLRVHVAELTSSVAYSSPGWAQVGVVRALNF